MQLRLALLTFLLATSLAIPVTSSTIPVPPTESGSPRDPARSTTCSSSRTRKSGRARDRSSPSSSSTRSTPQTPAPSTVGPNTYDALVSAGAFRKLTTWKIKTALEAGSVKEFWCTPDSSGMEASIRSTLDAVKAIEDAGGQLTYLAMDEPWVSGRAQVCGGPALEPTADRVATYMSAVARAHPALKIGLIEAYPFSSADAIETMVQLLRARGVPPAFLHMDVDWHRLQAGDFARDMKRLQAFAASLNIPFGIIIVGYNGEADALYAFDAGGLGRPHRRHLSDMGCDAAAHHLSELGRHRDGTVHYAVEPARGSALYAHEPGVGAVPPASRRRPAETSAPPSHAERKQSVNTVDPALLFGNPPQPILIGRTESRSAEARRVSSTMNAMPAEASQAAASCGVITTGSIGSAPPDDSLQQRTNDRHRLVVPSHAADRRATNPPTIGRWWSV